MIVLPSNNLSIHSCPLINFLFVVVSIVLIFIFVLHEYKDTHTYTNRTIPGGKFLLLHLYLLLYAFLPAA